MSDETLHCMFHAQYEARCSACRVRAVSEQRDEPETQMVTAEQLAERFHETYERLAPEYSYKTRKASAVPWADVPDANKRLMVAVCAEILGDLQKGLD